jgi:hypothetical protein
MKFPTIACIVLLIIMIIPIIHASELTKIKVVIVGNSTINLDETNRLIRASVQVENYDAAGEGFFYMRLIQPGGKILSEEEILITPKGNQVWGTQIAGMLDDEKIMKGGKPVLGQYEIRVSTELGKATASTYFTIIKPSDSQFPVEIIEEEITPTLQDNNSTSITEIDNEEETLEDLEIISNGKVEPKVPEWVKNIALWYGQGTISEDEFIDAIRFLIKEGVVIV